MQTSDASASRPGSSSYQGTILPQGFPVPPADWAYEWQLLKTSDSKAQLYSFVCSKGEAFGVKGSPGGHRAMFIIHGFGEHSGRYLHFPHFVGGVVDSICSYDHRGHGRSEGMRGHSERFDTYVDDARSCVQRLHEELTRKHGKAEIHLFAHSMGGLIGLRLLSLMPDLPIVSASISAPFLGIKGKGPAAKIGAARVLSATGLGWLQLDTGLDATQVSRDGAVVEAYRRDRLVHGKMTPRHFTLMMNSIADLFKRDSSIKVPLQMQVPLQDGIADPERALAFYRLLKIREKSLKTYPGYFHEGFNDIGKESFFADLVSWVKSHSGS